MSRTADLDGMNAYLIIDTGDGRPARVAHLSALRFVDDQVEVTSAGDSARRFDVTSHVNARFSTVRAATDDETRQRYLIGVGTRAAQAERDLAEARALNAAYVAQARRRAEHLAEVRLRIEAAVEDVRDTSAGVGLDALDAALDRIASLAGDIITLDSDLDDPDY